MGDIAEMMLTGILCERCGTYVGEETGYPVRCEDCRPKPKQKPSKRKGNK